MRAWHQKLTTATRSSRGGGGHRPNRTDGHRTGTRGGLDRRGSRRAPGWSAPRCSSRRRGWISSCASGTCAARSAARISSAVPVSPTKVESNRSSQSRRTAGVSRAGSVVTNTTLIFSSTSPETSRSTAAMLPMCNGTHVGTARVAEEEKRHETVGRCSKVVGPTFGVGQREVGLRKGRTEQLAAPSVIGGLVRLRTNREERSDREQHDRHRDRDRHRSDRRGRLSGRRRSGRFGGREAHARRQSRTGPTRPPIRRVASANGRFRR